MQIYAISFQMQQDLHGNDPLEITETEWRQELSLALAAHLNEGKVMPPAQAGTLIANLLRDAKIYVDHTLTSEPVEENRYSHAHGHYTEAVGHEHSVLYSLSLQHTEGAPFTDLQMGLDEWTQVLTLSVENQYGNAEGLSVSASAALAEKLLLCAQQRDQKLAQQFTIVPEHLDGGILHDYSGQLPPLPRAAGTLIVIGAEKFELPLYDADPSLFLAKHPSFMGVQFSDLPKHFGDSVLAVMSSRLGDGHLAFPSKPTGTPSGRLQQMAAAINKYANQPQMPAFFLHSLRHATAGVSEQVQMLAELLSDTRSPAGAHLRAIGSNAATSQNGLSVAQHCEQAMQALSQPTDGLAAALGALMQAQQLCYPSRLSYVVDELVKDGPHHEIPHWKPD